MADYHKTRAVSSFCHRNHYRVMFGLNASVYQVNLIYLSIKTWRAIHLLARLFLSIAILSLIGCGTPQKWWLEDYMMDSNSTQQARTYASLTDNEDEVLLTPEMREALEAEELQVRKEDELLEFEQEQSIPLGADLLTSLGLDAGSEYVTRVAVLGAHLETATKAAVVLGTYQKPYLERTLGKEIQVIFVSRSEKPIAGGGSIRFRSQDHFRTAMSISSILPEEQVVEPMSAEERGKNNGDILILLGADYR